VIDFYINIWLLARFKRRIFMTTAAYDDIAAWYNNWINRPLSTEVVLPTMLDLIGEIHTTNLIDLACGQGWFTRELARRGAQVTGIDISEQMIKLAQQAENAEPLGITYLQGDLQQSYQLSTTIYDGAVSTMALIDIPDLAAVFQTARHLLRPGGWFVFAVTHPCYETPRSGWTTLEDGTLARYVSHYFHEGFWLSNNNGGIRNRVGSNHRTLSTYLNTLLAAGFVLERVVEPVATGARVTEVPGNVEVPTLLFVRARVPEAT
jgi:2-polyprenyl-3-methyl-5-hydroxy-6-metoxy-1,4-benzoquinol methylase